MFLFNRKKAPTRDNWLWFYENPNQFAHMHRPAVAGKRHVVEAIHASYQVEYLTGLLTIQHGMEVVLRQYVHNQRDIYGPFVLPVGMDLRVTLHLSNKDVQCDVVPCLAVRGYTEIVER